MKMLTGMAMATAMAAVFTVTADEAKPSEEGVKRIGVIGLDTKHAENFTKIVNFDRPEFARGFKVTAAYKWGSPELKVSLERYPAFVENVKKLGIKVYEDAADFDKFLDEVDCVLLETLDGREHLWQAEKVFKSGKPCFIDKPVAATWDDVKKVYAAAAKYKAKWFTSSGLRYSEVMQKARKGEYGEVLGADVVSPSHGEPEGTTSDYYWYGVHGIEPLFTIMGTGAESVRTARTPKGDILTGVWKDGRIGTFRGLTVRGDLAVYGGYLLCKDPENPAKFQKAVPLSGNPGYKPLVGEILRFFTTGELPVSNEETLEIYRFMEAAAISAREGGREVKLSEVE